MHESLFKGTLRYHSFYLLYILYFTGNETVVKLKLPDNNFYPIYLIIYFPTDLVNSIIFLSAHSVPPFLWAILTLYSSFASIFVKSEEYYNIAFASTLFTIIYLLMDSVLLNQTRLSIWLDQYLHHHHEFGNHFKVVVYLETVDLDCLISHFPKVITLIILTLSSQHQISFYLQTDFLHYYVWVYFIENYPTKSLPKSFYISPYELNDK